MGTTKQRRTLFVARMAAYAAIVGMGAAPRPALGQTFNGPHQIIDGPGDGTLFNAFNGAVGSGGLSGQIEDHGGNCNGPHFHGTINGVADPNPLGCGWGHVAPYIIILPPATGGGRDHLGLTADPSANFTRHDDYDDFLTDTYYIAQANGGTKGMTLAEWKDLARRPQQADRNNATLPTLRLRIDIAPITGSTATNPNLNPAVVQDEVKQRLQTIFTTFKGTGDLAGVAGTLYDFNQWYIGQTGKPYYEWAGASDKVYTDSPTTNTHDAEQFQLTTQLACYEFVEFCAYIAGDQPQRPVVLEGEQLDDNGNTIKPAVFDPNRFSVYWGFPVGNLREKIGNGTSVGDISINDTPQDVRDDPTKVQRGQVVTGIGRWANNTVGYNHVGISIGNGQVISLGSGGLKKEALGGTMSGAFWSLGYDFVYAGDYQWSNSNPAPAHPTVPLTASKP